MPGSPEILQGPTPLAVLRLLQIHVLASDLASTALPVKLKAKQHALGELVGETRAFALDPGAPPELRPLADLRDEDPIASAGECVRRLPTLTKAESVSALVELAVSTTWANKDLDFAGDQDTFVAATSDLLPTAAAPLEVKEIRMEHKRSVKRLRRDSTPPSAQATLGVVMLTVAALTGGAGTDPASQWVGSFIGQQMGLSGAAATSAGLAWLGGGSLAAGGAGMAGGMLLVNAATHTVAKGAGLAIRLAGTSSSAFIGELAKLDVVVQHRGRSAADVVWALRALEPQLAKSRKQALEEEGGYRTQRAVRIFGEAIRNPEKIAQLPNDVKLELKPTWRPPSARSNSRFATSLPSTGSGVSKR